MPGVLASHRHLPVRPNGAHRLLFDTVFARSSSVDDPALSERRNPIKGSRRK
jgi:hypothetical protein